MEERKTGGKLGFSSLLSLVLPDLLIKRFIIKELKVSIKGLIKDLFNKREIAFRDTYSLLFPLPVLTLRYCCK